MRCPSSAARAAASTASGAGVPGWPTSRCSTSPPAASRSLATRMTSMTMKGGTRPRSATFRAMPAPPAAAPVLLHDDAEAVAARIDRHVAAPRLEAQAARAGQRVGAPDDALGAQLVAVLAQGRLD